MKPEIDNEDVAEFEDTVLVPLLARGAFDVAEDAVKRLRDREARKALQESIAAAKAERANTTSKDTAQDAAAILAARWKTYQASKAAREAGRSFLYAVRDLLAAQPDALPFE